MSTTLDGMLYIFNVGDRVVLIETHPPGALPVGTICTIKSLDGGPLSYGPAYILNECANYRYPERMLSKDRVEVHGTWCYINHEVVARIEDDRLVILNAKVIT